MLNGETDRRLCLHLIAQAALNVDPYVFRRNIVIGKRFDHGKIVLDDAKAVEETVHSGVMDDVAFKPVFAINLVDAAHAVELVVDLKNLRLHPLDHQVKIRLFIDFENLIFWLAQQQTMAARQYHHASIVILSIPFKFFCITGFRAPVDSVVAARDEGRLVVDAEMRFGHNIENIRTVFAYQNIGVDIEDAIVVVQIIEQLEFLPVLRYPENLLFGDRDEVSPDPVGIPLDRGMGQRG